jgi:multidrug resistance efflux pump
MVPILYEANEVSQTTGEPNCCHYTRENSSLGADELLTATEKGTTMVSEPITATSDDRRIAASQRERVRMLTWHKKSLLGIVLVVVLGIGVMLGARGFKNGRGHSTGLSSIAEAAFQPEEAQEDENGEGGAIAVKVIRPAQDPAFSISVEQPAYVAAYYQADLKSKVAGPVKPGGIVHDKGDRVTAGDILVEIDAPDLLEDVLQKEALVVQQLKELDLAKAKVAIAAAAVKEAEGIMEVKKQEIQRADASLRFRGKELQRFKALASGPSPGVTQDIVDERTEYYEAAAAASATARAAVEEARAQIEEAKVKWQAANVDVKRQEAIVHVARKDVDKAKAQLSFATIKAPFDGVITQRNVDPGSFVQNATTAQSEPLLTVARTDIVTVYMKVPDNYAPFVTTNSEAIIQMNSLPGLVIRGKVTRKSDSLVTPEHDRTMRVEVDLYNGSAQDYQTFLAREKLTGNADLKSHLLPIFPRVLGKQVGAEPLGLLPGQYGKMRLMLRGFRKAYLLPRSAVVSQGGASFVFLVKDGRAVKVPVEIQADNGKMVKLVLVEKVGEQEIKRELTEDDQVVASNQGELSNGQAVKPTPTEP